MNIAVDWACEWIETHQRTFLLGGYSQGAEAAARVHYELFYGRLAHLKPLYCGGFAFGNPSRQANHTYYAGPPTPVEGIAEFRQHNMGDDWCDLVDPADLYATSARGLTGEIERDVYSMCTELELGSGAAEFCKTFVANLIEIAQNLDGNAFDDAQKRVDRAGVDLAGATVLPAERLQPLTGGLLSVKGIAAAIAAAIDGLIFLCSPPFPTAPHCQYEVRETWPGMTFLGLAIQHVNDYAARRQPMEYT